MSRWVRLNRVLAQSGAGQNLTLFKGGGRIATHGIDAAGRSGRGGGGGERRRGGSGRRDRRGDGLDRAHNEVDALHPGDEEERAGERHKGEPPAVVRDVTEGELQDEDRAGGREDLRDDPKIGLGTATNLLGEPTDGYGDRNECNGLPPPPPSPPDDPRAAAQGTDDGKDKEEDIVDGFEHRELQERVEGY